MNRFSSLFDIGASTAAVIPSDGLDMTLGEFFSSPEFDVLEQEIK